MLAIKTILHPTDYSDASAYALTMAYDLARDYSAKLVLLHAVEPPVYYGEMGVNLTTPDEYIQIAKEKIQALVEPGADVEIVTEVVEGIACPEILAHASKLHSDIIVIGSHGRTGLGRVLMGSVAEEVARKAPCPVLIVKPPHESHHKAVPVVEAAAK